MITEFIKEHKRLCIIILIAIIIILIIIKVRGKASIASVDEAIDEPEASEPIDISAQLEEDETTQTVYNGYIYGAD